MIIDKNHEKHLASFEALWATQPVPARFKRRKRKTIKNP